MTRFCALLGYLCQGWGRVTTLILQTTALQFEQRLHKIRMLNHKHSNHHILVLRITDHNVSEMKQKEYGKVAIRYGRTVGKLAVRRD